MQRRAKTPTRTIRVSDATWQAVKAKAASEGFTITDVILDALKKYLGEE